VLFHYCFGGQEEARVLNTKQGNEDHEIRSRTEGSSSSGRYFSILKFGKLCFLFSVIPDIFVSCISDVKTLWLRWISCIAAKHSVTYCL